MLGGFVRLIASFGLERFLVVFDMGVPAPVCLFQQQRGRD
jgi:hypothetical protein